MALQLDALFPRQFQIELVPASHQFVLPDSLLRPQAGLLGNLELGQKLVDVPVGVGLVQQGTTHNGNPYVEVTLFDATGTMTCRIWDRRQRPADKVERDFLSAPVMRIQADVGEWPAGSGKLQLNVSDYQPDMFTDPMSLMPLASNFADVEQALNDMVSIYMELGEPIRSLTLEGMSRYWDDFVRAPAAKRHHHAWIGGLLVHASQSAVLAKRLLSAPDIPAMMARMLRSIVVDYEQQILLAQPPVNPISLDHAYHILSEVEQMMRRYKEEGRTIDADVCIAATFWHDLGKIDEYQFIGKIEMDETGKLLGHILASLARLRDVSKAVGIPESIVVPLEHVIASHHGKQEWGSPVWPQTLEAWVFHFIDYVASRLATR